MCSKIDPYYKTYTLSLFGSNVTDILTRIDSLCVELDKKVVDKSIKELLDIKGIKKYLDELIKLRKDLSFELAKFFGVDSKVFYNYFIKDNFDG